MNESIQNVSTAINEIAQNSNSQAASTSSASENIAEIADGIADTSSEMESLDQNAQLMQDRSNKSMETLHRLIDVNSTTKTDIDSMYKMETILKDYDEENDEDDFYFHWHVDRISKGYVKHSVEIIDKVENDRVYEEHYQKRNDVETYIELLEKIGLKILSYIVIFLNMVLNVKELYLYVKRGDL